MMKDKSSKKQADPRAQAVKQILSLTQLIRRRGTPDEAAEAIEWEKQLERRLGELEPQSLAA